MIIPYLFRAGFSVPGSRRQARPRLNSHLLLFRLTNRLMLDGAAINILICMSCGSYIRMTTEIRRHLGLPEPEGGKKCAIGRIFSR